MKIIRAIFLAELRGHRALALGIVTLLGLQGMLQTHWIYDATPMISLSVQAILALLCVLLLSKSLWHDAPLRKERYLATRPTNLLRLYLGKYAAFLAVIAVPSALVEFFCVRYFSFDLNIQAAAALQMFLIYASAIAAFIPVIWWMHSKKSIVMLVVMIVAAGVASNYYFWQKPQSYINEWSAGVPYSHFMILLLFAIFALMANLRLMLRLKKIQTIFSCVLIAIMIFLSLLISITISTRKNHHGPEQNCDSVKLWTYSPAESNVVSYRVSMPHQEHDRVTASHWSFNDVKLNGKDYTPWYDDLSAAYPQKDEITSVIKHHYPQAKEIDAREEMNRSASFTVPQELINKGIHNQKLSVKQRKYRWKIVFDLPLFEDNLQNYGNFSCEISGRNLKPMPSFANRGSVIFTERVVTIIHCKPFASNKLAHDLNRMIQVCILDPAIGEFRRIYSENTHWDASLSDLSLQSYSLRGYNEKRGLDFKMLAYSEKSRVLILAAEIIEEKSYVYDSTKKIFILKPTP